MKFPSIAALCAATLLSPLAVQGSDIVEPGAKVELLADGFKFTEGPTSDREGNVYFTDQPNDRILKWSVDGKLTTFMEPCGRANGLCFDRDGNLWAAADDQNELWRIDPSGKVEVVLKDFEGRLFNGPNDIWIRPDGGLYFTDPYYQRDYWKRGPMEQPGKFVFYLPPGGKKPVVVVDDLQEPNGLIGTPDGRTLYISDIGARETWRYRINEDGTLADKTLFCRVGSDGMTIDSEGNVYLTNREGVTVFNPEGEQIEQFAIPEPWTGNVCFGGADGRTLFITASKGLYGVRMRVSGVGTQ